MGWKRVFFVLVAGSVLARSWSCPADQKAEDQLHFGTGLLIQKEYALAVEEFDALLKDHPEFKQTDVVLSRLGEALFHIEQAARAVQVFERLVKEYPQSDRCPQAYYRLGQLVSETDHRKAAEYYLTVYKKWPEHKLAEGCLYWSAEERFRAEEWDAAADGYAQVLEKYPKGTYAAHTLYSLAWTESRRGRDDAAIAHVEQFLKQYPDHELVPECRLKMADALSRLKRWDAALAAYSDLTKAAGELGAEAALGRAWCLYEGGKQEQAAQAFAEAAGRFAKDDPRAAVAVFNAGNTQVELKTYDRALENFRRVLAAFPKHALAGPARYWEGYCLVRLGRHAEAEPILAALAAAPVEGKTPEILYARGEALMGLNKFPEAAAAFRKVAEADAAHALADEAAYSLMLALEKAGQLAEAEAAGAAFGARFPQSDLAPLARFALGEYRFRQDKFAPAKLDFEAVQAGAAKAHPELLDDAAYKLGWCAWKTGDAAAAETQFARVAADFADSPLAVESALLAGRTAEEAGRPAEAKKHYETCLRMGPKSEHAPRALLAVMLIDLSTKDAAAVLTRADAFLKDYAQDSLAPFANLYRGEALSTLERFDEAIENYKRIPADSEAAGDAAYGRGWAHWKKGRFEEALAAFREAASGKSPKAGDARFWIGRALEDLQRFWEAAVAYREFAAACKDTERIAEAQYRAGLCLAKGGKPEEAAEGLRQQLKAAPDSPLVPNILYDLGWTCFEAGKTNEARTAWQQLIDQHAQHALAGDTAFRLGELAYDEKAYDAAVGLYRSSLERPQTAAFADKVLYKLAWALKRQEKAEEAAVAFEKLARDFPKSELAVEAWYRQGKLLQDKEEFTAALAAYRQVTQGDFLERALLGQAECLRGTEALQESLLIYQRLAKEYPESEWAAQIHLGYGHCSRELKAYEDAVENYEAVVEATDTIHAAEALMGIGYCRFAQEQYKDAVKAFLKVDILYGYESLKPEALSMLSRSWEKAGDAEKAKKYRDLLKERYPDSDYARDDQNPA